MLIWESQFPFFLFFLKLVLLHIHPQLWITYIHNCGLFTSWWRNVLFCPTSSLLWCQSHSSLLHRLCSVSLSDLAASGTQGFFGKCGIWPFCGDVLWVLEGCSSGNLHLRSFDGMISPQPLHILGLVEGLFRSLFKWLSLTCPEATFVLIYQEGLNQPASAVTITMLKMGLPYWKVHYLASDKVSTNKTAKGKESCT